MACFPPFRLAGIELFEQLQQVARCVAQLLKPEVPRTNNARESEFRELRRRLLSTTGQTGAVKRLLLREGAWELIPGPSPLAETVQALAQVEPQEFLQEQRRVRAHRQRFRLHTRSTKQSEAQLKGLVRRWKALPATAPPE